MLDAPARPEWFRWVQALAEGGMIAAVAVWWWHALWTLLLALAICAAVVWECVAAMWRMWPPV